MSTGDSASVTRRSWTRKTNEADRSIGSGLEGSSTLPCCALASAANGSKPPKETLRIPRDACPWILELISPAVRDRKSTRLNSSHVAISYAVFCLKKKNKQLSLQL